MMLKVGIVGLPNVGKSTLFNAVLKREQALSANYPFATIEPNVGVVDIVDDRLKKLQELYKAETGVTPPIVYSSIEFVDIAGLVEGASKGEGLGNQFLANIREVDLILQVVRDFSDTNIVREHSKNPSTDVEIINSELIIKDLESLEKKIKTVGNDTKRIKEKEILEKYFNTLNSGTFAHKLRTEIDEKDYLEFIRPLYLLTDKDMILVFNVDETDNRLKDNKIDEQFNYPTLYINAKLESELASLSTEDQISYLSDLGIPRSGLDKITNLCHEKLGMISFFTVGDIEIRAWDIKADTNAKRASARIHTDFEDNFIKAEIIGYDDYLANKTKLECKNTGKLRLEGKDYIVKDGDIVEFKIGRG